MGKVFHALLSPACTIKNARDIACIVPTDHLIVCSVSNWGGYALATACTVLFSVRQQLDGYHSDGYHSDSYHRTSGTSQISDSRTGIDRIRREKRECERVEGGESGGDGGEGSNNVFASIVTQTLEKFLPSDQDEINMCERMVAAGARDGVTGQMVCSVDGMPLSESLRVLGEMRCIVL